MRKNRREDKKKEGKRKNEKKGGKRFFPTLVRCSLGSSNCNRFLLLDLMDSTQRE